MNMVALGELLAKAIPWIIPVFLFLSFFANLDTDVKLPKKGRKDSAPSQGEAPPSLSDEDMTS